MHRTIVIGLAAWLGLVTGAEAQTPALAPAGPPSGVVLENQVLHLRIYQLENEVVAWQQKNAELQQQLEARAPAVAGDKVPAPGAKQ